MQFCGILNLKSNFFFTEEAIKFEQYFYKISNHPLLKLHYRYILQIVRAIHCFHLQAQGQVQVVQLLFSKKKT